MPNLHIIPIDSMNYLFIEEEITTVKTIQISIFRSVLTPTMIALYEQSPDLVSIPMRQKMYPIYERQFSILNGTLIPSISYCYQDGAFLLYNEQKQLIDALPIYQIMDKIFSNPSKNPKK